MLNLYEMHPLKKRKDLFWPIVLKVSVSFQLAWLLWTGGKAMMHHGGEWIVNKLLTHGKWEAKRNIYSQSFSRVPPQ